MANLTLRYLDELSYVLNRRHLASQAKASSVGDLLNAEEERFAPQTVKGGKPETMPGARPFHLVLRYCNNCACFR
ncbi:unnamed protein product, partial [Brenthis ino]